VRQRRVGNPLTRPKGPWQTLAIIIAAALAIILISQTGFGAAILRTAGLESGQTGYTALAFTRPVNLPEQVDNRNVKLPLGFSIQNATNNAHHYGWEVLLVKPVSKGTAKQTVLASGTMDLRPGTTGLVARGLPFTCTGREQVIVALTHSSEHLDAWLSCPG
jgi:hypothetical protein